MGLDQSVIETLQQDEQASIEAEFVIQPDNYTVWRLFLKLLSSWRITAMGDIQGLDMASVQAVAAMLKIEVDEPLLDELLLCEAIYIKEQNKRRPKRRPQGKR